MLSLTFSSPTHYKKTTFLALERIIFQQLQFWRWLKFWINKGPPNKSLLQNFFFSPAWFTRFWLHQGTSPPDLTTISFFFHTNPTSLFTDILVKPFKKNKPSQSRPEIHRQITSQTSQKTKGFEKTCICSRKMLNLT